MNNRDTGRVTNRIEVAEKTTRRDERLHEHSEDVAYDTEEHR